MLENIPPCSRKKGCFCTFNDFKTFVQLSFPSLPQISTSFPNHAFRNAHFSRVRAFQQGKPPLYFVACYYAQYRIRSAILRNHLKGRFLNFISFARFCSSLIFIISIIRSLDYPDYFVWSQRVRIIEVRLHCF